MSQNIAVSAAVMKPSATAQRGAPGCGLAAGGVFANEEAPLLRVESTNESRSRRFTGSDSQSFHFCASDEYVPSRSCAHQAISSPRTKVRGSSMARQFARFALDALSLKRVVDSLHMSGLHWHMS
jgi:hypothetical protein